MHWTNIGLIIVAALDLGMALFIWLRNPKHRINISLSLTLALLAIWTFAIGMLREATAVGDLIIWLRILSTSATFMVITFLFFSIVFPYPHKELYVREVIVYLLLPIFPLLMLYYPNTWFYIDSVSINPPNNNFEVNDIGFLVFIIYILYYLILAFKNLFDKYKTSGGFISIQLFYLLVGTGIIAFFGTLIGGISCLFFNLDYFWIGPYFGVFMVAFLSYFVYRYRR